MARRRGLGRGLDALIPGAADSGGDQIVQLQLDQVQPNPRQPRQAFPEAELEELAQSIKEHGLIQPLVVASGDDGGYVLIAGERRLHAARLAGLSEVPALLRQATEQQLLVWALIENLQREDLNPLEAAEGYRQLAEDFELSHEAIAERVGKSRPAISNSLRLLQLPKAVQDAVRQGQISEGHARALLSLASVKQQSAALEQILAKGLNVRETEALTREKAGKKKRRKAQARQDPQLQALQNELEESLGTKVQLRPSGEGGTLTLYYYSDEELEHLVRRLRPSE